MVCRGLGFCRHKVNLNPSSLFTNYHLLSLPHFVSANWWKHALVAIAFVREPSICVTFPYLFVSSRDYRNCSWKHALVVIALVRECPIVSHHRRRWIQIFLVSVYRCCTSIGHFWNDLGIYAEDFTYFDTSRVWVFCGICVFDTTLGLYTMQEPKITVVSIWFSMVWTQIITRVYKDSDSLTFTLSRWTFTVSICDWYYSYDTHR